MGRKPQDDKQREPQQGLPGAAKTTAKVAGAGEKASASPVRRKHALAVGSLMGPLVGPALARHGAALAQMAPHWQAICPLLARYSVPESLKSGVLTVAVASDAVKQELHYVSPQIMEGVNMLLGYVAVTKVRAVTRSDLARGDLSRYGRGPAPMAQAKPLAQVSDSARALCNHVRDEGLREALTRLAAQVIKKK